MSTEPCEDPSDDLPEDIYPNEAHLGTPHSRQQLYVHPLSRLLSTSWMEHMCHLPSDKPVSHAILDYILGDQSTERDAMVGGAVIAWLGTPAGLSFFESVMRRGGLDLKHPSGKPVSIACNNNRVLANDWANRPNVLNPELMKFMLPPPAPKMDDDALFDLPAPRVRKGEKMRARRSAPGNR